MKDFHGRSWPERPAIVKALEDDRFRQLGGRILASERPDLLSDCERVSWHTWLRDRLLSESKMPWLTVPAARAQVSDLREDCSPESLQQLSDIEHLLMRIEIEAERGEGLPLS